MILGPRSPRKHQIHLHLEGKQKTPSQHHRHPSAPAEAEGTQRSLNPERAIEGVSPPTMKRRFGAPSGLAIPANPETARQLPVPIRRNSQQARGPARGRPPSPPAEPVRAEGPQPRVRAGAGPASRSPAGPQGPRGRGPRAGPTLRRASARVPFRGGDQTSGSRSRGRPVTGTARGPRDQEAAQPPRVGPGPPPRPRAAEALSVRPPGWGRLGVGNCGGGRGSREALKSGAGETTVAIFPCSLAGPSDSQKDPLTRPREPQKIPLPSSEASSDPGTSRVPSPAPPQNQQARGRDGGRRAAGPAVAEAEAPAPPPPAAATGTFVWRPLGLPRWGEGGRRKIPPGLEVRAPSRAALQRTAATDPLRLPPGKGPGGGRGGGKLKLKSLPPLQHPSSSLRTRLTDFFPSPTSFPDGLLDDLGLVRVL
nr:proline-rich protein 2-like [Equus caballus]